MIRRLVKMTCFFIFGLCCTALIDSCASVKPYQRMYIDDPDMQLKARNVEDYEISCEAYREGASGANGTKTGGGCGCY